jgi:HK97 family phage portal protein
MALSIFGKGREAPPQRKASAAGRVVALAAMGRSAWGPRDAASLTKAGFTDNPIGFRAVKLIAEAAAALPLLCQDCERRFEAHPVLSLLRRPNPGQGRAELLEALYGQLLLTGDGYLEAVGEGGLPVELHVLRSDRMSVVPDRDGWPAGFEYAVAGRKARFATEAVCHVRSFHPQDDHHGLSPMQAAAAAVEVHNAASRWSKALLDNAARPSGAIVHRPADGALMTQEQFERLQAELEAHHQGARNAGRPMLLEGGLDWKPMGFSPTDMEFRDVKAAAAREIATAYGVPPMLLGIPGDATYANYAEAHRAFYRLTVLPLAQRTLARLSEFLAGHAGEEVEIRVDLDGVPALAAEREAQWRRVSEAAFLTDAEKRALLGLPPLAE